MPKARINFGAALAATLIFIACNSANSTPRADSGAAPASSKAGPTNTTDPIVAAADKGRIEGDRSAKTWVIIASYFQCPFCRQWHSESYETFVDEYVRSGK